MLFLREMTKSTVSICLVSYSFSFWLLSCFFCRNSCLALKCINMWMNSRIFFKPDPNPYPYHDPNTTLILTLSRGFLLGSCPALLGLSFCNVANNLPACCVEWDIRLIQKRLLLWRVLHILTVCTVFLKNDFYIQRLKVSNYCHSLKSTITLKSCILQMISATGFQLVRWRWCLGWNVGSCLLADQLDWCRHQHHRHSLLLLALVNDA